MDRLVLEISPQERRQIKTLAAFSGMTMKEFVLSKVLGESEAKASRPRRRGKTTVSSETDYLSASPAMKKRLLEALRENPSKRRSFASVEELRHALGI